MEAAEGPFAAGAVATAGGVPPLAGDGADPARIAADSRCCTEGDSAPPGDCGEDAGVGDSLAYGVEVPAGDSHVAVVNGDGFDDCDC